MRSLKGESCNLNPLTRSLGPDGMSAFCIDNVASVRCPAVKLITTAQAPAERLTGRFASAALIIAKLTKLV